MTNAHAVNVLKVLRIDRVALQAGLSRKRSWSAAQKELARAHYQKQIEALDKAIDALWVGD